MSSKNRSSTSSEDFNTPFSIFPLWIEAMDGAATTSATQSAPDEGVGQNTTADTPVTTSEAVSTPGRALTNVSREEASEASEAAEDTTVQASYDHSAAAVPVEAEMTSESVEVKPSSSTNEPSTRSETVYSTTITETPAAKSRDPNNASIAETNFQSATTSNVAKRTTSSTASSTRAGSPTYPTPADNSGGGGRNIDESSAKQPDYMQFSPIEDNLASQSPAEDAQERDPLGSLEDQLFILLDRIAQSYNSSSDDVEQ